MRKSIKNNKGFSLVEMLVALTILVAVIAPLTKILISSSKVNQKTQRVMSATEIAQNMFEGVSSKRVEDAMIELAALSISDKVELDKPLSVIPAGMTYDKIGVMHIASTDPATGDPVWVKSAANMGSGYLKSVTLNPSTNAYRCKGFKEEPTVAELASADMKGKCKFYIQGLKQADTYYDLVIKFDASTFKSDYGTTLGESDPMYSMEKTDYVYIPTISDINSAYDGMSMEGSLALENIISSEFRGSQIVGLSESEILKDLKRTYTIDIKNIGTPATPQVVAEKSVYYEYTKKTSTVYSSPVECIFDSSTYGATPRNLYIYYTPNYNSTGTDTAALDQFVINNPDSYDVNVYLIRMQQGTDATGLGNVTDVDKENNYTATVVINENEKDVLNTKICTNLNENILKADTLSNHKNRERTGNKITYKATGLSPTQVKDRLDVKALDAQKEEARVYDVTIDVYMGKSLGTKHDNNGNYSYDGAAVNDFPKGAKITTFTGKLVQ